jgi:hypothetical protein
MRASEKLPAVLEWLVPYHTREKMHRVRGGAGKKVVGIGTEREPAKRVPSVA